MEEKVLEILERNFNESIEFDRNKATEELLILFGVIVSFVCDNCQSKEGKKLTTSTTQCKKCHHLQAN